MSSYGQWVAIAALVLLGAVAIGSRPADFFWMLPAMAFFSLLFSAIGVGCALIAVSIARLWKPELIRSGDAIGRGMLAGVIGFAVILPLPKLLGFDGGIYVIPLYAAVVLGFFTSLGLIVSNNPKPPTG